MKNVDDRIHKAYSELMTKLFGSVPENPHECSVERDDYNRALQEVQERYGLVQGDPDFLEWVLTAVGRSPMLMTKGEIVYATRDAEGEIDALGEAPSGETS